MRTVLWMLAILIGLVLLLASCGGVEGDDVGAAVETASVSAALAAPPTGPTAPAVPFPHRLTPAKRPPNPNPCITCPDRLPTRALPRVNPATLPTPKPAAFR